MSFGAACQCPGHDCRQYAVAGHDYCPRCLAGWHTAICPKWTDERVNPRLADVDLFAQQRCGRCGASHGAPMVPAVAS